MAYLCFQCDMELVPDGKYCHSCGAPTYSTDRAPQVASRVAAEARSRIKQDVRAAAQVPTNTRMTTTLLLPQQPKPNTEPIVIPRWKRFLQAPIWRRPLVWILLGVVVLSAGGYAMVTDMQDRAEQEGRARHVALGLRKECTRQSEANLAAAIARIQAASGGRMNLAESAMLLEWVVRTVGPTQGDCANIIDVLSQPDRFERMMRPPTPQ